MHIGDLGQVNAAGRPYAAPHCALHTRINQRPDSQNESDYSYALRERDLLGRAYRAIVSDDNGDARRVRPTCCVRTRTVSFAKGY